MTDSTIYQRPAELLQNLIRFNTTNPPGNETACVEYIAGLCHSLGIETRTYAKDPERPNLVARIKGEGRAAPLLLYGHVDVVSTANQDWQHPPFSGDIADGMIWGRGALDMKGGVAMMTAAFLRAEAEGLALPGDVILCILSDEEAGGEYGAAYLVEGHPELFAGVKYAIGEFGGFPIYIGGKKFFAVQVSEKSSCRTIGHIPRTGGTRLNAAAEPGERHLQAGESARSAQHLSLAGAHYAGGGEYDQRYRRRIGWRGGDDVAQVAGSGAYRRRAG